MAKMSKKLGFSLKPDELANAFEKMDRQKKGEVDFDHFSQVRLCHSALSDCVYMAWSIFLHLKLGAWTGAVFVSAGAVVGSEDGRAPTRSSEEGAGALRDGR